MDEWIETPHGTFHARIEGDGPAILLAHGYHPENNWQVWENNIEALAGAGFRVYALDLLGYGQSRGAWLDEKGQAQGLIALLDAEGLETATLGGVSWGGLVALEVALAAPSRVERLLLVDSAGVGRVTEEQMEGIVCPTLIVWGEDDSILPLADAAWFGATIPDSQVVTIADVTAQEGVPDWGGHHPMRFRPAEFNRVVLDFLRAV